jgi:hypothetical protein
MLLVDTLRLLRPAIGDSLTVAVSVTSLRRGIGGPERLTSVVVRNPDAPPPPVDSLRTDTLTFAERADSLRTVFYTSDGKRLTGELIIEEGDSVMAVAQLYLKPGQVRPTTDTIRWSSTGPAVVRIAPVQKGLRDTAYLVAVDCVCRESGDRENPPVLDMRSGQYAVRDGKGGYRPVTPLSADPFR